MTRRIRLATLALVTLVAFLCTLPACAQSGSPALADELPLTWH